MIKLGIVGGTFDHHGGRPSFLVTKIHKYINENKFEVLGMNGGYLSWLLNLDFMQCYDVLIWMPNIDNDVDKILPKIKQQFPHLLLIQTKRVIETEYQDFELIKRLLDSHSTLGLKITKPEDDYLFSILDPLGNCWGNDLTIPDLVPILTNRIRHIMSLNRVGSSRIDDYQAFDIEDDFVNVVTDLGHEFTEYVTAVNPTRFLGNASTRCCHGFPSVRDGDSIYMSKRNVDKTIISSEQFVKVRADSKDHISYYGGSKPSVDTPVQLRLYEYYPNINYIVHGHVYIVDAPFTPSFIPCGYIEEFDKIIQMFPNKFSTHLAINLLGHGCIILSSDVQYMTQHTFQSRPMPEYHNKGTS